MYCYVKYFLCSLSRHLLADKKYKLLTMVRVPNRVPTIKRIKYSVLRIYIVNDSTECSKNYDLNYEAAQFLKLADRCSNIII